jgi:hypothetical protein
MEQVLLTRSSVSGNFIEQVLLTLEFSFWELHGTSSPKFGFWELHGTFL